MSLTTTLTADAAEFIRKLEEATEGSRELDAAIRYAVVGDMCRCDYAERSWCEEAGNEGHDNENGCGKWLGLHDERKSYPVRWQEDERLPHYTTSLDAALTLIPPGAEYELSTLYGPARASLPLNGDVTYEGHRQDGNIVLALCIAALKARSAQ